MIAVIERMNEIERSLPFELPYMNVSGVDFDTTSNNDPRHYTYVSREIQQDITNAYIDNAKDSYTHIFFACRVYETKQFIDQEERRA